MCGIALALFTKSGRERVSAALAVKRMCDQMSARGPDAFGMWTDPTSGLVMGHRRLAILDLDPRADQPMHSECDRYAIVFNGEIYNFRQLREQLLDQGYVFQTTSDTEVLLAMYQNQGEEMLPRLRGMFAIAIWDKISQRLFLARDPYGIKPLYIALTSLGVLVASQVKALLASGVVSSMPDVIGQAGFWLLGSVPEPRTWFRDVQALPAGNSALIEADGSMAITCWADIGQSWRRAARDRMPIEEVKAQARAALLSSVSAHLVSDVPIGIFLSGGLDSGSLVALIDEIGAVRVTGITVGFSEFANTPDDEVDAARSLAREYGILHHVRIVTRQEFETDLPAILAAMDQPSVDGINVWYASKATAEIGLKVAISGVGGDELFQGYTTFSQLPTIVSGWRFAARSQTFLKIATRAFEFQSRRTGNGRWRLAPALLSSIEGAWFLRRGLFGLEDLPRLLGPDLVAEGLAEISPEEMVREMTGTLPNDARLALGQIESMCYLRNQLLRDGDWASMNHSIELRTPLVDSFLLRDTERALASFRNFGNKRLLAEAATKPLKERSMLRRKTGFGTPVQRWLRDLQLTSATDGMSRGWAQHLVREVYSL